MITFLLLLTIMLIALMLAFITFCADRDGIAEFCLFIAFISVFALFVLGVVASVVAIREPIAYAEMANKREALVASYEFYQENAEDDIYHDTTYHKLLQDINDFNDELAREKIFRENKWTSWYFHDYSGIEKIVLAS